MWVLTLKQPWAWMVIHGTKDVENRSWCNSITRELQASKQPFAIHAGATMTRAYYENAVAVAAEEDSGLVVPSREKLVFGAVIGTAVIANYHAPETWKPRGQKGYIPWRMRHQYGWELLYRTPLPVSLPARGQLGFWEMDDRLFERAA